MTEYEKLLPFAATDWQREILETCAKAGGMRPAAKKLGRGYSTIKQVVQACRKKAEQNSQEPLPTDRVIGISVYENPVTGTRAQWTKYARDAEDQARMLQDLMEGFKDSLPKAEPVRRTHHAHINGLLNLYVIADYHLGMYAWREETGSDWDLDIAEQLLTSWFGEAAKLSPPAEKAVLTILGDFLHWDSLLALTPTSNHVLDADTRRGLLRRTAIRILRQIVRLLLTKYKHVHIIVAEGNHDLDSSGWLSDLLAVFYEAEPRVSVDIRPDPYYVYEHGKTALFFHHGHLKKPADIDSVFAAKFREVFGRTRFAYAHMGHMHNQQIRETNLMLIEQHRTLASPDAYAARGGFLSGRDAKVITYHEDHGEVSRLTLSPEMVSAQNAPSQCR